VAVDSFDPEAAATALTATLRDLGTPARAEQEKRYLKSDLEFFGVAVPDLRRAVEAAVKDRQPAGQRGLSIDRETGLAWTIALWRERVHERRAAAVEILTLTTPSLVAEDLAVVEQLIRESLTWAYVDTLAGHVAGVVAQGDPASWRRIDPWAIDGDFWVRRSALLALLAGIRAGRPDRDRFMRYSGPMLAEKEFFIRKAIGWVLRELSRRDPEWVAAWTEAHLAEISGVTFREAVRRLPEADKTRLEQTRAKACG
jgi:3-methyladenine DNA glycosylase AlkD